MGIINKFLLQLFVFVFLFLVKVILNKNIHLFCQSFRLCYRASRTAVTSCRSVCLSISVRAFLWLVPNVSIIFKSELCRHISSSILLALSLQYKSFECHGVFGTNSCLFGCLMQQYFILKSNWKFLCIDLDFLETSTQIDPPSIPSV